MAGCECDGSKPMMISTKPIGNYALKLPFHDNKQVYLTLDYSDKKVSLLVFKYFLKKVYDSIIPFISHLQFVNYIADEPEDFGEGMLCAAIESIEEDIRSVYGVDFSAIDHISLMQYEGENDCGHVFFGNNVSSEHIKQVCSVILSEEKRFPKGSEESISSHEIKPVKFDVKNSKYIRKLIAGGGNGEFGLAFNRTSSTDVPVCCGYVDVGNARKEFPIEVIIKKNLEYTLYIGGFRVYNKHNEEYTVKENDGIDEVVNAIRQLSSYKKACEEKVKEILNKLKGQQHGTSVIFISDNENSEVAKRLSCLESAGRALPVSVVDDVTKVLKHLSRMDGAIVVQVSDTCRILLVNVILDGLCTSEGEPARGARYNVVSNFVRGLNAENKIEVVGAVLSTDENKFDVIK